MHLHNSLVVLALGVSLIRLCSAANIISGASCIQRSCQSNCCIFRDSRLSPLLALKMICVWRLYCFIMFLTAVSGFYGPQNSVCFFIAKTHVFLLIGILLSHDLLKYYSPPPSLFSFLDHLPDTRRKNLFYPPYLFIFPSYFPYLFFFCRTTCHAISSDLYSLILFPSLSNFLCKLSFRSFPSQLPIYHLGKRCACTCVFCKMHLSLFLIVHSSFILVIIPF